LTVRSRTAKKTPTLLAEVFQEKVRAP